MTYKITTLRYRCLWIPIITIWFIGLVVAIFSPDSVISDYWLARIISSAMSNISNPQGIVTSKSSFPQVTLLYYSVIFWSIPFWLLLWWKWLNSQLGTGSTDLITKEHLSILNRLVLFLFLPFLLFLTYAFSLNHGGDMRLFSQGSSRLHLGLIGMGIPAGACSTLAIAVFIVKRLFTVERTGEKQ